MTDIDAVRRAFVWLAVVINRQRVCADNGFTFGDLRQWEAINITSELCANREHCFWMRGKSCLWCGA
jgi:hypothetical protein